MRISCFLPFAFLVVAFSCTTCKRQVFPDDFIDTISTVSPEEINTRIVSLRDSLSRTDDITLHRRLAVYYRLLGTPSSRRISIDEIDKAIRLAPGDPLNHVEKGLTLYAMQFAGDAEASFRRAVELDPGCFHAWYHLARMKKAEYLRNMCFTARKEEAIDFYKKAFNIDNRHEDTLFNLGFLHLLRRMYNEAGKYASKAAVLYPGNPRHHLLLGSVHFRLKEFEKSGWEFAKALELMDEPQRLIYLDTSLLQAQEESEAYMTWPLDARNEWNRRFWLTNDPTPSTEINERLLSHYERVFFARELLEHKRIGMEGNETARGAALIKYGLPDKLLYDLGAGLSGPFVIWEYFNEKSGFRLYFQDEFLNGDYHIPIDSSFWHLADATQNTLDNIPQVFNYPVLNIPTPLWVESVRRRGNDQMTRIDFSVAFPDSAVADPRKTYDLTLSIFDSGQNRILNNSFRVRPDTLLTIERSERRYYIFVFGIDLMPRIGDCRFVVEFSGGNPLHRGVWTGSGEIIDLHENRLMSSDIGPMFSGKDRACTRLPDPIPVYSAGGDICLSFEIYGLLRDRDNLAKYRLSYSIKAPPDSDKDLGGLRRVIWWMARSFRGGVVEKAPYMTSSFDQSVGSSVAFDELRINLGSLEPGNYIISISILDLVSGDSLTMEKQFIVTD